MPKVGATQNVDFYIYSNDHAPPHVHAYCGEHACCYVIDSGEVLVGGLPSKAHKAARAYVLANRNHLMAEWNRLNP